LVVEGATRMVPLPRPARRRAGELGAVASSVMWGVSA